MYFCELVRIYVKVDFPASFGYPQILLQFFSALVDCLPFETCAYIDHLL